MNKTIVIAEAGINHNGSVALAKELIDIAEVAKCDYVKFQKRTPDICVPELQKSILKKTPWGEMKYIDYKHKIEFEEKDYLELFEYTRLKEIKIFASVWDIPSVEFMKKFSNIGKIPSALITDHVLCIAARKAFKTLIISTGMSTEEEIEECISKCAPDVVMHTNSAYPSKYEELNLRYINHLISKYPSIEIGYSGHEYGLVSTFAAVAMGAKWVERHITVDRTMWGSDQMASIEPIGLIKLVNGIRTIDVSMGPGGPREVLGSELPKRNSLRGT